MEELALLLRGPSSLARGERELHAAHVSVLNDCIFCAGSHGAGADWPPTRSAAHADAVSDMMRLLLALAAVTRDSGHAVTPELVAGARAAGATDVEIRETVLIAAAFGMFNRYADALGIFALTDPGAYAAAAPHVVEHGYPMPPPAARKDA